jgi:NIMA (never in mitosis gene a)-related kinase 1/4/5
VLLFENSFLFIIITLSDATFKFLSILIIILFFIGEGAYSSVYQVRRHADGAIYALKKVKMVKLSDKEKENALNEFRILASIKHQNISAFNEAFIDEPSSSLW